MYPQRAELMGPRMAREVAGSNYTGRFAGKMSVVQNLMDEGAWPNIAAALTGLYEQLRSQRSAVGGRALPTTATARH